MNWALMPLKKYVDFSGRARRKEYWSFYLLVIAAFIAGGAVDGALGTSFVGLIVYAALLLPLIAVSVRRMHDTNRSGWWLLVPVAPIIFSLMEGTSGANRFGADPKALGITEEQA